MDRIMETDGDLIDCQVGFCWAKAWAEDRGYNALAEELGAHPDKPSPAQGHPWWRTKWARSEDPADLAVLTWVRHKVNTLPRPKSGEDLLDFWRALYEREGAEAERLFPELSEGGKHHTAICLVVLGLLGLLELPSVPL